MGATSLTNGVNGLSISTDIQFGDTATPYSCTNGFSNTPSSIRSNSPSQMSSSTNGIVSPDPQQIPTLEQHLQDNGLRTPRFPDVTIHIANFPPISAHALFLCRSPYLSSLLLNQPPSPPYTINLPASDPHLTYDALLTSLQYLYTLTPQVSTPIDPSNIISHMAACCALGIYPTDLVSSYRSILLKQNLTIQSILPFISFLLSTPHPLDPLPLHPGPYPPFTTGLLATVATYITTQGPLQLQSTATALPPSANTEDYKALLIPLPFELLKAILEHPSLAVRSEKQRYELAKSIVSKRAAKLRKRDQAVEESVILKVGGGEEGVQVMRGITRRRAVWKASARSRDSTTGSK